MCHCDEAKTSLRIEHTYSVYLFYTSILFNLYYLVMLNNVSDTTKKKKKLIFFQLKNKKEKPTSSEKSLVWRLEADNAELLASLWEEPNSVPWPLCCRSVPLLSVGNFLSAPVKYRGFQVNNKRSIINERDLLYNEIRDMKTGNYDTVLTTINNSMI